MAFPAENNTDVLKAYGIQLNHVPKPRAPPMFFRPPSPLVMERPQPLVSDVSLIMDSASTSMVSTAESLPENIGRSLSKNVTAQSNETQQGRGDISEERLTNLNFANYFPTPSLNQSPQPNVQNELSRSHSQNQNMSQSQSYSKEDSGQGASVLSSSKQGQVPHENEDSTDASEELENDAEPVTTVQHRFQNDDVKILKSDMAAVLRIVCQQQEAMNKLTSQFAAIISSQEKILDRLPSKIATKEVQIQTNENFVDLTRVQMKQRPTAETKFGNGKGVSSKSTNSTVTENSKKQSELVMNDRSSKEQKEGTVTSVGERNIEDFSTLLKHLEVCDLQGPSMYSEASIKPNDFPQFNDESFQQKGDSRTDSPNIGPSASAYGSSSEDEGEEDLPETPLPTVSYYNNVLTTVNRFLGGNDARQPVEQNNRERLLTPPTKNILPKGSGNDKPPSATPFSRASTASYSSSSNGSGGTKDIVFHTDQGNKFQPEVRPNTHNQHQPRASGESNVVDATKRYLESIGARLDSPTPPRTTNEQGKNHQQNYMIQQNVFNSIYIPTVNCVPVIPESMNSNSGIIENLANKYISPADRNQYEALTNKNCDMGMTETTVYGMSSSNLSFATKQYLQRYGLVDQGAGQHQLPPVFSSSPGIVPISTAPTYKNDRILDMTALRNQPKLL